MRVGEDGEVSSRWVLIVVASLCALMVVVAGASRASYSAGGVEQACPERVWSTALDGVTAPRGASVDACAAASQERLFTVAAALMGLVLISSLLARVRR